MRCTQIFYLFACGWDRDGNLFLPTKMLKQQNRFFFWEKNTSQNLKALQSKSAYIHSAKISYHRVKKAKKILTNKHTLHHFSLKYCYRRRWNPAIIIGSSENRNKCICCCYNCRIIVCHHLIYHEWSHWLFWKFFFVIIFIINDDIFDGIVSTNPF